MLGANQKSPGTKAVLGVGPLIPLALALLHGATSTPSTTEVMTSNIAPAVCGEDIEDYQSCHSEYPTGCSSTGKYDAALNKFKNETAWTNSEIQKSFGDLRALQDLESQFPSGLGKNNHADYETQLGALGEGGIAELTGYLYAVKAEGKESSNCQLEPGGDDENVDFHIYVGFDSGIASRLRSNAATNEDKTQMNSKSVIVEMTPHYRAKFHPEWSLSAVQQQIGKQVKITGQLIVDNEHYVSSQDCGHKDASASCWRGTVWELHPVTDFESCENDICTPLAGETRRVVADDSAASKKAHGISKSSMPVQ